MDLFKLEKDKYNNLLLSLDYVMKEKGKDYHQNFGIAIYVLENNELIFDNFTKGHLFNDEVDIFYNQFLENLAIFNTNFRLFFDEIVKDEKIYPDLRNVVSSVCEYVELFIDLKDNYQDIYTKIEDVIEKSRRDTYY